MDDKLPIERLDVTVGFNSAADEVWRMVKNWPIFELKTIGEQLVSSMDSVAANIIEGGHRESDLEAVRHFVIARASAEEALNWLERVAVRGIEPEPEIKAIILRIRLNLGKLERLIIFRRSRSSRHKPTL